MSRDFFINGESLLSVKSNTSSSISSLTELGLAESPIRVSPSFKHKDIAPVDAWGQGTPETQWMLADVTISAVLIHFDQTVLEECLRLSMGGPTVFGEMARAGTRLGNNLGRFVTSNGVSNNYIGLNISSPVATKPYRFFFTYLMDPPAQFPLGTEKSLVPVRFRCIPYTTDPYGGGTGAQNYILFDRGSDA